MDLELRIEQLEKQKKILQDSIRKFPSEIQLAKQRIEELEEINRQHQKLNAELRQDNKKLALQVEDKVNQLRRSGGM
jgi:prefoldin subunit 5